MTIHENAFPVGVHVIMTTQDVAVLAQQVTRFKQCFWCGQTCSRWADRCHRCGRWF